VLPISGASCRNAGTAPACSSPRQTALHSVRSAETRAPRASSLHVRVRDVEEGRPKRLAHPCRAVLPPRLPVSRPSARRRWQSGPFGHGVTASAPSRAPGPRRDSTERRAPCGVPAPGRDPSIGGVQPSCQRSAPGIRIDSPARFAPSSGGCRGSRRFTRFDPRRGRRPGVLFRRGVRPTSFWRSWFLRVDRLCSDSHREGPTPLARPTA
jgi:hypothetical protein